MRARIAKTAAAVALLVLGAALLAYPYVSSALNQHEQNQVIDAQEETTGQADAGLLEAERRRAVEYNERLLENKTTITDPFDPSRQDVGTEDYWQTLNLNGDGVMATLFIPVIDVRMPVYHGTSDEVLQKGVGHLERTSVPIGGPSTFAVLSGHTGLPQAEVLDKLNRVNVGDYFVIRVLGEDHAYEVKRVETVLPDETESLKIVPDEDWVALVTCTPYGVNTHRLIVHGQRAELPDEWWDYLSQDIPSPWRVSMPQNSPVPYTMLGAAIAAGVFLGWPRRRRAAGDGDGRDFPPAGGPAPPQGPAPSPQGAVPPGVRAAGEQRLASPPVGAAPPRPPWEAGYARPAGGADEELERKIRRASHARK